MSVAKIILGIQTKLLKKVDPPKGMTLAALD